MLRHSLSLALVFSLVACAGTSPPTRFYALEAGPAPTSMAKLPELSLALGPIRLPDTLDRPQIVTRSTPHARELAEFHRWAGNLKEDMGRQLVRRLMLSLGTERVYLSPLPRHRTPDFQVRLDVLVFDGRLNGSVELVGSWTLLDRGAKREIQLEGFELRENAAGPGYEALVAAHSRLVAQLADRIASTVAKHAKSADP